MLRALACLAVAGLPLASALADAGGPAASGPPRSLLRALEGAPAPGVEWPAAAPQAPAAIRVSAFRVEGNRAVPDDELAAVLAPFQGRAVELDALRQAVEAVLRRYHALGYLGAQVSLPPQRIEQGVVRLVVREGEVRDVRLALAAVPAPDAEGQEAPAPPASAEAEEPPASALRFFEGLPNARPGPRPRASLVGSDRQPADRLVVELQEGSARGFGPENDLFAALPDGGWQVGASLQLANPAGRGGHLSAGAVADGSGDAALSGRFDTPLDVAASTLAQPGRYLDEELVADLGGPRADGRGRLIELAAERPLLDGRRLDLSLRTRLRHREQIDQAAGRTTAHRRIDSAQLSTRGRLHDELLGGGTTAASLSATLGVTDLTGFEPHARRDAEGARTAGAFARVRASLARLQSLGGPWSLFGALMAQGASKNLDGSQQFSIGGLAPERGFAVGETFGDEGFRLNADLRYAVPQPVLGGRLQLALFYDQGALRLRKRPQGEGTNAVVHRSLGVSLRQDWGARGFVHVSAGRQLGSTLVAAQAPEGERPYRFWLRLGMTF